MFIGESTRLTRCLRAACAILATVLLFAATCGCSRGRDEDELSPVSPADLSALGAGVEALCLPAGDAALPVALTGVSARGAVLMEASSGEVAFGQNENARLPMASTTKIMTALVALESMDPKTPVTIPPEAVGIEGSSIYLVTGEVLTLEQLLYALLLESANDAAAAIALAVSGSIEAFAEAMNQRAAQLGLTDTHFVNPHGLDDENHYTTARELALIAKAALEIPLFREICSTERKTIPLHGEEGTRLLLNHNRLLGSYEGCIGVKTGYTKRTGRCLVSAARRDGVTLIAVTLNAPDDWRDHTAMLDYGFALYESVTLCALGGYASPLWVVGGEREYVMVENAAALAVTLRRDHGPITCTVELPRFVYAPLEGGRVVGLLRFAEKGVKGQTIELGSIPLQTAYAVSSPPKKTTIWERLRGDAGA